MDEMKLLSYFNGELSEEEVLQVETWSKASEENRKLLKGGKTKRVNMWSA